MCIGAIAATKGEYAAPPNEQPVIVPEPDPPGLSLLNSSVAVIWKENIWRPDNMPEHFQKSLAARHAYYEVSAPTRSRSRRQTQINALKEKVFLGKGTIVVCPPNLVGQWRSEIAKHVQPGFLKVAVLDHHDSTVPEFPELLDYDVLLFSRSRFDREYREGMDKKGRRAAHGVARTCQCPYIGSSRTPDCRCFKADAVYRSPLMSVRWKRMIVDEGHFLGSGGKTRGISVTERLSVERKWIVSGTPSDNLLGVTAGVTIEGETPEEKRAREQNMLEERKAFQESEAKDLDRLGHMVRDFLRLRPWAPCGDRADQVFLQLAFTNTSF